MPAVPAIPSYTDARPKVMTYFKIFSPSRGGRMCSVYESAPDGFNFSQSWGWKSSSLVLDDGIEGVGMVNGSGSGMGVQEDGKEEGKLRFTVSNCLYLGESGMMLTMGIGCTRTCVVMDRYGMWTAHGWLGLLLVNWIMDGMTNEPTFMFCVLISKTIPFSHFELGLSSANISLYHLHVLD